MEDGTARATDRTTTFLDVFDEVLPRSTSRCLNTASQTTRASLSSVKARYLEAMQDRLACIVQMIEWYAM